MAFNNPQFSANLHPSYFNRDAIPEPEPRTRESLEIDRNNLIPQLGRQAKHDLYREGIMDDNIGKSILNGTWSDNPLADSFFSRKNISNVRKMIKFTVYHGSDKKHMIDQNAQSEAELLTIMRSMYLQYAQHLPGSINYDNIVPKVVRDQIQDLNEKVVTWITPRMISQAEQYLGYLYDASHNPMPLEHPKNLSSTGTKTLRSETDVLFGDDDFFGSNKSGLFSNQFSNRRGL